QKEPGKARLYGLCSKFHWARNGDVVPRHAWQPREARHKHPKPINNGFSLSVRRLDPPKPPVRRS
ncbi:MAG: hypothetical protein ACREOX_12055, partial [Stenotrophomonas sp.]